MSTTTPKSLSQRIQEARKAIAGMLGPSIVILVGAVLADSDGGSTITAHEWGLALVAALGTSGVVYGVRNAESPDPTTSTPDPSPDPGSFRV